MKKLNFNIDSFYNDNKKIIIPVGILIVLIVVLVIVLVKMKGRAVNFANRFVGVEEIGNNQGFFNPTFQKLLQNVGWKPGNQWCGFFAKMVYTNSLKPKHKELAKKLMNGSTQLTLKNFKNDKSGLFEISDKPKKGGLVIWQSLKDKTRGHIGVIAKTFRNKGFQTIEGNSNIGGSQGIVTRANYGKNGSPKGLKVVAYVNPV